MYIWDEGIEGTFARIEPVVASYLKAETGNSPESMENGKKCAGVKLLHTMLRLGQTLFPCELRAGRGGLLER